MAVKGKADEMKQVVHAVLVPFPAYSHANALLQIAKKLCSHAGFLVTFVNAEIAANGTFHENCENLRFRAIPDGFPVNADRNDFRLLAEITEMTMPAHLRRMICEINETEEIPVSCVIADFFASWSLDVAWDLQISATAAFWPGVVAAYALIHHLPGLLSSDLVPADGIPEETKLTRYFPSMPLLSSSRLPWLIGSDWDKKFRFQFWQRSESRLKHKAKLLIFNSFDDLERPILQSFGSDSRICTVGPLIETPANKQKHISLQWLDKQEPRSVVYLSFGSCACFGDKQIHEIALALEASGKHFLWVVRKDCRSPTLFPEGFEEKAQRDSRGCFVAWAPQISVLSHESVACFLSHCGWNSVLESIAGGTPLLCLPFAADQFINCSYVVDSWGIGLRLGTPLHQQDVVVHRSEILGCISKIINGSRAAEIRRRVAHLRDAALAALRNHGSSSLNFQRLVYHLKQQVTQN